jgi:hypothetical protein
MCGEVESLHCMEELVTVQKNDLVTLIRALGNLNDYMSREMASRLYKFIGIDSE